METGNGSANTISLIMEVEEITPEEAPSDSDSIECAILRSSNSKDGNKNVVEGSGLTCTMKAGINKAENNGRKCLEELKKDKNNVSKEDIFPTTALGQDAAGARKGSVTTSSSEDTKRVHLSVSENRLVAPGNGELQNTGSLEEKLSAMFREDKNESSKPSDNGEEKSGPTLEEQLTELFQDRSEGEEMPSITANDVNSPVEENLIAIFEEEDGGRSLSDQVFVAESRCHRKEHIRSPEAFTDKELSNGKGCSVLLEKDVHLSSKSVKSCEKKTAPVKRKSIEKEIEPLDFMKEMKEARVVLKKLKLASSNVGIKFDELPDRGLESLTNHKPAAKSSLSPISKLKLSDEKQNESASKVTTSRKNTAKISALSVVSKTKDKTTSKIIFPKDSLSQQEIKGKKLTRLSNRNSTDTSQSEKLKLKPEKQPVKTLETLPNFEVTKNKINNSSKSPVKEQSEIVKRKRGRPPLNRNKEHALSPKEVKRKPVKTPAKVQEPTLVSRVSERLQLKLMKTRAVRKRKLHGDKHEGTTVKLRKPLQKKEHILKLHRTAISLAKKRKTAGFTTYGLARKRRLLNAVKSASTKKQPSSGPLMSMQQTAFKQRGPLFKEDNIDNLPKVTVALTPVLLKRSGNLVKTTVNRENSICSDMAMMKKKKSANVKTSLLRDETDFTDSEALSPVLLKRSVNLSKTTFSKEKSIHSDADMKKKNTNVKTSQLRDETNFAVSEASSPAYLKSANMVKTTMTKQKSIRNDADMNKKNINMKISQLRDETNFTDSEAEKRNTSKKFEDKVSKTKSAHKGFMVTRSKGERGRKLLQQQKKGIGLRTVTAVNAANMKKTDDSTKTGNASMETKKKKKNITACGLEVRNNEGVVELLLEDAANLTENGINDIGTDKTAVPGEISPAHQKNSSTVEVPSGMTDAQKMVEMRKAIWNLETRIDRYKLRQQAEERMVVYLSNKLHFYESNKYVQALMRMLKDAAPGPQQNQDAVFITDLLLGYRPENDDYEKES